VAVRDYEYLESVRVVVNDPVSKSMRPYVSSFLEISCELEKQKSTKNIKLIEDKNLI
jgi:hypothetical protein